MCVKQVSFVMKKSQLRSGLFKTFNLFMGCAALITISTSPANAVTPGCNADVWDAMVARAQAQLAYDVAVIEEIIEQPDSVLMLTCFDDSLHVTAENAGEIFSGTFNNRMDDVVGQATDTFVSNNFSHAMGVDIGGDLYGTGFDASGTLGGGTNTLGTLTGFSPTGSGAASYSCDHMQQVWDDMMAGGINSDVPYMSFEDLVAQAGAALPADPTAFETNINTNASIIATAANSAEVLIDNLPVPAVPSFAASNTLEDVLTAAGIIP